MISITEINQLSRDRFIEIVGPVYEKSPWIADEVEGKRPFADRQHLETALRNVVEIASGSKKVELIKAHPDLVGRTSERSEMTRESVREQQSAGLGELSEQELEQLRQGNSAYRAKFGFPFVVCARLNKKEAILKGLQLRIYNSSEIEINTALQEIFKIAQLRLEDLISEK